MTSAKAGSFGSAFCLFCCRSHIFMKPSFSTPFPDQRIIPDRRFRPTSFISTLRFGGRRKSFRRIGERENQYVDRLSLRTFALTFTIFIFSTLDAILTIFQLNNGATELNPIINRIIQFGIQPTLIIKSLGVGLVVCFLASHQNFKISFYGMHALAGIFVVLLAYHMVCVAIFF